ncbi:MAG: EI24 domain-containing protein [Deltaproteobacteria bacterium]|nr:EI24 domain-containing protein [Deltaproteobacteria bacterium]
MDPLHQLHHYLVRSSLPRRAWTGAWCVMQGVLMTLRSPALLRIALVPLCINLALYPVGGWVAWQGIGPVHHFLFPWSTPDGVWAFPVMLLSWLVWVVVALVLGLTALLVISAVGSAVASPFLDVMSQRVEALLTRETVPMGPGALESVWRTTRIQGALLLLYLPCLAVTMVISFIPGIGTVLGPLFQASVTVLFLCLQMIDWPAERRRLGVRDRVRLILANKAACAGFGAACWFMMLFPFTLPFAAAGGTMLLVGTTRPRNDDAR